MISARLLRTHSSLVVTFARGDSLPKLCYILEWRNRAFHTATAAVRNMSSRQNNPSNVRFQGVNSPRASSIPRASYDTAQNTFTANVQVPVDPWDPVQTAKAIFFEGLQNVMPSRLINSKVQLQGSLLKLANEECTNVDLSQYNKKYVVGFGKGCLPMAESLLSLLNGLIDRCVVSVPVGSRMSSNSNIEVHRGAKDNIPDEDAFDASQIIVDLVRSCTPNDLLIVLISGGGSALLPYPIPPVTLNEKQMLIKSLSRAGCTITELNTVRKRLSLVKGGGLVHMCNAGKMISLIVSDVCDNPLDIIASGPTVPNLDSPGAALKVIEKYGVDEVSPSILELISTPPQVPTNGDFGKVINFVIGDNQLALDAAAASANKFGYHPFIITTTMSGNADDVGSDMVNAAEALANCMNRIQKDEVTAKTNLEIVSRIFAANNWSTAGLLPEILEECNRSSKGICLLFGGETTVNVRGHGMGGRNQELVLSAGIHLDLFRNLPHVKNKIAILSAGTDGIDGPTNAAGAVVESCSIHNAQIQGISPVEILKDNNSYYFFDKAAEGKYHIVCGHTETNVMDVTVIVITKRKPADVTRKQASRL